MDTNRLITFLVNGLVFFEMGLAIALQSRTYSRLELARSLKWLAFFGFAHCLHEWGFVFLLHVYPFLADPITDTIRIGQLLLLAASFTFLLEFGLTLFRPPRRPPWTSGLAPGVFVTWMIVSFAILPPLIPDLDVWRNVADALARYFIGLPGGVLAAVGLYQQARYRVAPLAEVRSLRMLQIASGGMGVYALLSGLISPPIPFFPGNIINTTAFQNFAGLPPYYYRSMIGLVWTIALIRGLEIFDLETVHMIEGMKKQQIQVAERERIARDLHDGVIQKIYTAGLLVEASAECAQQNRSPDPSLQQAVSAINEAISDLRRSLNDLDKIPVSEPLENALKRATKAYELPHLMHVELTSNLTGSETLSPIRTGHIISIINESLSNAVHHGNAHRVKIQINLSNRLLDILILDDGVGMPSQPVYGYGLRNMHDRARMLGGQITIDGKPESGTSVMLQVPLEAGE